MRLVFTLIFTFLLIACGSGSNHEPLVMVQDQSTSNDDLAGDQPEVTARPEISEDYQYKCFAYSDTDRVWKWTFRPSKNLADQYDVVVGEWDWIDRVSLLVKPVGNPQVVASVAENGQVYLEGWGQCDSTSQRKLHEQFTRPGENSTPNVETPVPTITLITGETVVLSRVNFTRDMFTTSGNMWECVDQQYGRHGNRWSYLPGATGVVHYADGTADVFDDSNGNIVAAGSQTWTISDGIYYGPLPLNGLEMVSRENNLFYIYSDNTTRTLCYESAR